MATIKYLLKSEKNPATIYIRVREGRAVDAYAPTKFFIDPANWNQEKGKPRNKGEQYKKLNADLDELTGKILTALNNRQPFDKVNAKWVKDVISPPLPVSNNEDNYPTELVKYFDVYINDKKNETTEGTIKKANVVKNLLSRMQDSLGTPILIEHINLSFKNKFENYCLDNNYAPNTIARALKFIKTVCIHARNRGLETSYQLDGIRGSFQKVSHIHLTIEEIHKVATADLKHDYLDNARDWLVISCYTGQRVSDFLRFNKSMIRTEKGKKLIEFTQTKTGKEMAIPLHPEVIKVLNKRGGEFPRQISDQRFNEYIKTVCKEAGLINKVKGSRKNPETNRKETGTFQKWQLVASHIGRRSFATNFYGDIPTGLLKAATGHSTEKQFLAYIGKSDTEQAKQLADYF